MGAESEEGYKWAPGEAQVDSRPIRTGNAFEALADLHEDFDDTTGSIGMLPATENDDLFA